MQRFGLYAGDRGLPGLQRPQPRQPVARGADHYTCGAPASSSASPAAGSIRFTGVSSAASTGSAASAGCIA